MHICARHLAVVGAVFVGLSMACSQASPTSPSDAGGPEMSGSLESSTVIRGTVAGLTGGRSTSGSQLLPASTLRVCVAGTSNCDYADEEGNFELKGNLSGDIQLDFTGPEGLVSLMVPGVVLGETVVVTVEINGTTAEIEIESRSESDDDSESEDSGDDSADDVSEDDVSEDDVSEDDASEDEVSEDDASEDDESEDDESEDDDSEDDDSEDDDSEDDDSEDDDSEDDDSEDATAPV